MEKANLNSTLIIFHDLRGVVLSGADGLSMTLHLSCYAHNFSVTVVSNSKGSTMWLLRMKILGCKNWIWRMGKLENATEDTMLESLAILVKCQCQ